MRRPSRIIEIFSMSVLDLFASALAAFIMITVILFPYFNKHQQLEMAKKAVIDKDEKIKGTSEAIAQIDQKLEKAADELKKSETFAIQLKQCESAQSACRAALTQTFLVVGVEWEGRCDVDLYITDPAAREFSYRQKTIASSGAELSLDMMDGPGIEIWTEPSAAVGDYIIRYNIASCKGGRAVVRGWVVDRSDSVRQLPQQTMQATDSMRTIAVVRVTTNGEALLQAMN
jgi:hypothetical protein